MQGTNVLFGQIAVVFGIVIAGVWSATQWTAAALGYQLRLGSPWFDFLGTSIYHPWKLFEWWFFFGAYARTRSYFDNSELSARGLPDAGELALIGEVVPAIVKLHPVPVPRHAHIGAVPVHAGGGEYMGAIDRHALRFMERRRIAVIDIGVILGVEPDLTAIVQLHGHTLGRYPLDRRELPGRHEPCPLELDGGDGGVEKRLADSGGDVIPIVRRC